MEAKEVVNKNLLTDKREQDSVNFAANMQRVIEELREEKKYSAMRLLASTLNSYINFVRSYDLNADTTLDLLTSGRLKTYQEWLLQKGASRDTLSSYMRSLRAAYNRIIPVGSEKHNPKLFADVHTAVASQTKRALEKGKMNILFATDMASLPENLRPILAYFLLMFFFRGMPFIDLAYLRKKDVKGDCIIYCRHKTGKQLTVRIPKEAIALFQQYKDKNPHSPYLFPILNGLVNDEWKLYQNYQKALRRFNKQLDVLARLLLPGVKLSSYTARHTWATLSYHRGTSIGVISQALGHSSVRVTETYLKPFDNERVDEANDNLLREIMIPQSSVKALLYTVL